MGSLTLYTRAAPVRLHPLSLFTACFASANCLVLSVCHQPWFLGAVLSKVANDSTTPAPKLSVVSSFRWGELARPECRERHLPDPGGRSNCYIGFFQHEGLIDGLTECHFDSKGNCHLMCVSYPVGECTGGVLSN
jgi:hypothetical protein